MPPRLPPRRLPPVGFARRGAGAYAPANTIESFRLARRLGATGLASDVWLTADGQAVLDDVGTVGGRFRRVPLRQVTAAARPASIPLLRDLYAAVGTDVELLLAVRDPAAIAEVIAVARDVGAEERLWVAHPDADQLTSWRALSPSVRLVQTDRLSRVKEGLERRANALKRAGVDALDLPHDDWTGGLVTLAHRFELDALARDVRIERALLEVLDLGVDGVTSDHPDVLRSAITQVYGPASEP